MNPIQSINGVTGLPEPCYKDGYRATRNKVWSTNAGRSQTGKMIGDIIAYKWKLELKFSLNKQTDITKLSGALNGATFFNVKFYNPESGEFTTKIFYAGDPTYPVYTTRDDKGVLYQNVSVNLIEQ